MGVEREGVTSVELMRFSNGMTNGNQTVGEPEIESLELAWDDVSGAELDPSQATEARWEERVCAQDGVICNSANKRMLHDDR